MDNNQRIAFIVLLGGHRCYCTNPETFTRGQVYDWLNLHLRTPRIGALKICNKCDSAVIRRELLTPEALNGLRKLVKRDE